MQKYPVGPTPVCGRDPYSLRLEESESHAVHMSGGQVHEHAGQARLRASDNDISSPRQNDIRSYISCDYLGDISWSPV